MFIRRRVVFGAVVTGVAVVASIAVVLALMGASGPSARYDAVMFDDPATGQFLMGGGQSPSGADLSSMWEWSGASWKKLQEKIPSGVPGLPTEEAYDAATHQVLVATDGDSPTWVWHDDSWTEVASDNAGDSLAIAYDQGTQQLLRVVLGASDVSTWLWNGSAWDFQSQAAAPDRIISGMAYDAATKQLMLMLLVPVAGEPEVQQEPWIWTGTTWRQLKSASTIGIHKVDEYFGYDAATRQVVAFGENDSGNNETWTWNGDTWTRRPTPAGLLTREAPSLAYDSSTKQLLLFGGGLLSGQTWGDTWSWNGTTWSKVG